MSLTLVPAGQIATIVTSLEMTIPPRPRPLPACPLRLQRWTSPEPDNYRALFRRVGEPWLWFSRLVMPQAELTAIIGNPAVEIFAVLDPRGIEVGVLELDFREPATAEITFLGLVPELTGKGFGRWLMAQALSLSWRKGVTRVWVHTCTLDHPSALGFYRAQGFIPFARSIETFADPRKAGIYPAEAAPHIPLL
jgi:GNAT superfamily N-acetyltransferase